MAAAPLGLPTWPGLGVWLVMVLSLLAAAHGNQHPASPSEATAAEAASRPGCCSAVGVAVAAVAVLAGCPSLAPIVRSWQVRAGVMTHQLMVGARKESGRREVNCPQPYIRLYVIQESRSYHHLYHEKLPRSQLGDPDDLAERSKALASGASS